MVVLAHLLHQLRGDNRQFLLAHDLDRTPILSQCIVESQFIFAQALAFGFARGFREPDQLWIANSVIRVTRPVW